METIITDNKKNGSFLMQKFLPETVTDENFKENSRQADKFLILEISNFIDSWEQELLFGENGFFSLKGKEVQNKTKEFIAELNKLINSKINEIKFEDETSKILVNKIKNNKINAISLKMQKYEQSELYNLQLSVCDEALNSAVTRAVLYKNDEETVITSLKNGLSVLAFIAEKENWSNKTYKKKENSFKSKFYNSLINAYIKDKDINAYRYFEKYKDSLLPDDSEKINKSIDLLKTEIIAYNWSKEVFSYNLSEEEQNKELSKIKDKEVKKRAEALLKDFALAEKQRKEQKEKEDNEKNWQEVINTVNNNINDASLSVDYTLKENHISSVKAYIRQIKTKGYVITDVKKFVSLFKDFIEDFENYKKKDISSFRAYLSEEDFEIFKGFLILKNSEYFLLRADYKYVLSEIKEKLKEEDIYELIKQFLLACGEYKTEKNKKPDLQERRKIADVILAQFANKKEGEDK
jgi:hypothetical protein